LTGWSRSIASHVVKAQGPTRVFDQQVAVMGSLVQKIFIFKIVEVPCSSITKHIQGMR
jgi:hypothetical protein